MDGRHEHFKLKIAVSGAAKTDGCGEGALDQATELGREIVRQGAVVVTGATTGFPLWAAKGAKEEGGVSVGLSPALDEESHVNDWELPIDYMDLIIYTGSGFAIRDVLLTRSADAVVIGCGRIGTIHEFTVAFENKKPLGILRGPWAQDELIEQIIKESGRAADNPDVIYEEDPKVLVQKLLEIVESRKVKHVKKHVVDNDRFSKVCEGPDCPPAPSEGPEPLK